MRPSRRRHGIRKAVKVLRVWTGNSSGILKRILGGKKCKDEHRFNKSMINTRKACSCPFCGGHARRLLGKTMQEKRADVEFDEQLKEEPK